MNLNFLQELSNQLKNSSAEDDKLQGMIHVLERALQETERKCQVG